MAEALTALAIAALTLALLTSAGWGLRIASDRRAEAAETTAADWLAARRALFGWAAGATAANRDSAAGRMIGTATTARMIVEPNGTTRTRPYVAELRVEAIDETTFALIAARHIGATDARVGSDTPQDTEILRARDPIRLLYLLPQDDTLIGLRWRYETGSGSAGLPAAIGVEVGERRMLTTRIFATTGAACLARLGPGGLEEEACRLR